MPKACDVKRGDAIEWNGQLLLVREVEVQNPSARGAATLYKMRFSNVRTGLKVEERFKGDDILTAFELERRAISYSYSDGDDHVFMDNEDFTQYSFKANEIAEELLFISDGIQGLQVTLANGEVIGLELPQSVEMTIEETAPAMKAASATSRTKPAKFATGLSIQVPEYISQGERVRIHTGERRFMGRAD